MRADRILEIRDLEVKFPVKGGPLGKGSERFKTVIDHISFSVFEGETFGIVGETGSGKSTIAKTIVGINYPSGGEVLLAGRKVDFSRKGDLINLRKNVGIIFQDPVSSLNPKLKIFDIILEGLNIEEKFTAEQKREKVREIAGKVGLNESDLLSYPGELSGGEKQRVSLARALISPKKILILDEPTSSLDVSIQAQILNLLQTLKREFKLTFIFITHDFNVIRYMCDRLGVLYYGRMLEISDVKDAYENPLHPYTKDLMGANITVEGRSGFDSSYDVGEPAREGCIYLNSCRFRMDICSKDPPMFDLNSRYVKCWLYRERENKIENPSPSGIEE